MKIRTISHVNVGKVLVVILLIHLLARVVAGFMTAQAAYDGESFGGEFLMGFWYFEYQYTDEQLPFATQQSSFGVSWILLPHAMAGALIFCIPLMRDADAKKGEPGQASSATFLVIACEILVIYCFLEIFFGIFYVR